MGANGWSLLESSSVSVSGKAAGAGEAKCVDLPWRDFSLKKYTCGDFPLTAKREGAAAETHEVDVHAVLPLDDQHTLVNENGVTASEACCVFGGGALHAVDGTEGLMAATEAEAAQQRLMAKSRADIDAALVDAQGSAQSSEHGSGNGSKQGSGQGNATPTTATRATTTTSTAVTVAVKGKEKLVPKGAPRFMTHQLSGQSRRSGAEGGR